MSDASRPEVVLFDRLRPDVVIFDVVETLASLDSVRDRLERLSQPRELMDRWFTRLLRDAMALTAAGDYQPFAEIAASALRAETRGALTSSDIDDAMKGFGETMPQPDAAAAMTAARKAGFRVFALSNGSVESTQGFLERAELTDHVEQVLSVDMVRTWKPARAPYDLAVERAGVSADQVALVAVHSWDIHGAHRAGMTTGWLPRLENVPTPAFTAADVTADTLPGVIEALAALPVR